jgi:outer membrane protein insertion porin family
VRKVLLTGLHYTRPDTVAKAITLHPGDPAQRDALMDTQRNLYELALFQRGRYGGRESQRRRDAKTVLLQAVKRGAGR